MKNYGLKARMLLSGSLLFLLYSLVVLILSNLFNISYMIVILLTLLFVVFQYIYSQKLILKGLNCKEISEDNYITNFVESYRGIIFFISFSSNNSFLTVYNSIFYNFN